MANSFILEKPDTRITTQTVAGAATVRNLNNHIPPWVITPVTILSAAFTPTGTTVTINPTADDAITFTNAGPRESICIGAASATTGRYFKAGARRKPGTTGAIVAQSVVFTINSVEIGRFTVKAADAYAEPESGFVELCSPAADARLDITTYNLICTCTAADTDIEIFFEFIS